MQDDMAAVIDILDTAGLSKSQQRVVDTLRRHPSLIPFADTAEVARHAEVNNSTAAGPTCNANCAPGTSR